MRNQLGVPAACMALMLGEALTMCAQPAIKIDAADSNQGIRGSIRSENATLEFTSRVEGGVLRSEVRTSAGVLVTGYSEARVVARYKTKGGPLSYEVAPDLTFEGAPYRVNDDYLNVMMTRIARSPEGELIRYLALNVGSASPSAELSSERRGLQVAFQALQNLYENPSDTFKETVQHPPLGAVKLPKGCNENCLLLTSSDFEYSASGGYVLKSLSDRLVLARNYTKRAAPAEQSRSRGGMSPKSLPAPAREGDPDPNMVDNCFGRCGAGCGDWTSTWIGQPTNTLAQEGCDWPKPSDPPEPDPWCYPRYQVWEEQGPVLWTTSGNVTGACEAHDSCVRNSPLGLYDPICETVYLPPALADYLSGAGTYTTWSYQGWLTQGSRFYVADPDRMCCTGPQN